MKIGIVGCGNIGRIIALALDSGRIKARLGALYDVDEARSRNLAKELKCKPPLASLQGVVDVADLIVEAATPAVMPKIVRLCLMAKKDVLPLSVGGLFGNEDLFDLAKERGCRIHIPSGAIGGIDLVRAAGMGTVGQVTLTTRKPPAHLLATPYLKDKGVNLEKIRKPVTLFEGSAREAVKYFPMNLNVAATLSFAGLGADRTVVKVVADPALKENVHEIEVTGDFGRATIRCENVPSPDNPATSYLAPLSAIALLERITSSVSVGT